MLIAVPGSLLLCSSKIAALLQRKNTKRWALYFFFFFFKMTKNAEEHRSLNQKKEEVSSLPFSLFQWRTALWTDQGLCIPPQICRAAPLSLSLPLWTFWIIWPETKHSTTHKATQSDKTEVTWNMSHCCFLDLERLEQSLGVRLLLILCVWLPFPGVDSKF